MAGGGEGGRKFRDEEGDRGLVWRSAGRTRCVEGRIQDGD